jgi:cell division protein FtsI/penicillin-binding protein 2
MKFSLQKGSRSRFFAAIVAVIMLIFVARLFYLQVIKNSYYTKLSDDEQVKRLSIPAKRGLIYALDGSNPVPLAMNQTVYTVFVDPQSVGVKNRSKVVDTIKKIAGGNAKSNLDKLVADTSSRYQVVATNITKTQAQKLKSANLSGVGFQEGTKRVYPEGSLASQILGFVNSDGDGQYGVEQKLNSELKGKNGLLQSVTDVSDVPLTIGGNNIQKSAQNGKNVVLTVDRNVQSETEQALEEGVKSSGATDASVLVMNPNNGKIWAMANYPNYDVSNYQNTTDISAFSNKVISLGFEPASVLKTYVMAAGLNEGTITPNTTYNNTDSVVIDGDTIKNASLGHTGTLTMQDVLDWSLNTGSIFAAERFGNSTSTLDSKAISTMYQYFHDRFGLGQLTGIELAGESAGDVISPKEQEGNAIRYANMSFGQGLDVTMLQVASGFCSIINGGTYYKPTVVDGTVDDSGNLSENATKVLRKNVVSQSVSDQIITMLQKARASASFLTASDKKNYTIGGKTGTAQAIVDGKYVMNQTVGTYLGFGGTTTPEYVIMVRVAAPGKNLQGGPDGNPIFVKISNFMINYLKLQPKE